MSFPLTKFLLTRDEFSCLVFLAPLHSKQAIEEMGPRATNRPPPVPKWTDINVKKVDEKLSQALASVGPAIEDAATSSSNTHVPLYFRRVLAFADRQVRDHLQPVNDIIHTLAGGRSGPQFYERAKEALEQFFPSDSVPPLPVPTTLRRPSRDRKLSCRCSDDTIDTGER